MSDSQAHALAIIGIGCLFPGAEDPIGYWASIREGVDCIGPVPTETHWNPDDYFDPDPKKPDMTYARRGGFLRPVAFSPVEFGIAPNDIEATDTSQLLGLVVAREALYDAGYTPDRPFDRSRVSVILGVTGTLELVVPLGARLGHPKWRRALKEAGVPTDVAQEVVERIADSYVSWQENSFPGLLGNVVAGRIANRLDLGGTNCVVDAACASSLSALHLASLELLSGRADVVVSGGVDTFNDIFMYMCFSKTPALSPTGDAKPFDSQGDGTILGEGLGIVVLKRLADAQRDGDRIYAVICGIGSSSDGKGNAIYAPSAAGQVRALRNAYEHSGVSPATIELVEGHGTGTRVGDAVEATALTEVYRAARFTGTWCALGSVKSQIGHTKAAAGAAGLIKAALALHHKVLPPTIKVQQPLDVLKPGTSPFYVNTRKRPWLPRKEHPRRAAVSSFGFGGSNFHCVLEEYRSEKTAPDWDGSIEIVALSGASASEVRQALDALNAEASWSDWRRVAHQSRHHFRSDAPHRLILVVQRDRSDREQLLARARALLDAWQASTTTIEGICYGVGPAAGRLAALFPGQGSQQVGMLRDLVCLFPEALEALALANHVCDPLREDRPEQRVSDYIYPPPPFSTEEADEQTRTLRDTRITQPALAAVSLATLRVLDRFGLRWEAAAGHSFGELTALHAAGVFSAEDLFRLAKLRGARMAQRPPGSDPGAMLAVFAGAEVVEPLVRELSSEVVLANYNSPGQTVLSGPTAAIDQVAQVLRERQLRSTKLPVSGAFHSPLVADAQATLADALRQLSWGPPRFPVFANTTAQEYPVDAPAAKDLLAGQLAQPVRFVDQIVAMIRAGVRTFVEVGPGTVLTRFVEAIAAAIAGNLAEAPTVEAIAIDASVGKRSGIYDLAWSLARLAARGHAVQLTAWEADNPPRPQTAAASGPGKRHFTIPISGANVFHPKPSRPRRTPALAPGATATTRASIAHPMPPSDGKAADANSTAAVSPQASPGVTATATTTDRLSSTPIPPQTSSEPTTPMNATPPSPRSSDPTVLTQALSVTQQSLAAFQKLHEQTAALHRQFLENQAAAQRTLQTLVEQQHALLTGQPLPPLSSSVAASPSASPSPSPSRIAPQPGTMPTPAMPTAGIPMPSAGPTVPASVVPANPASPWGASGEGPKAAGVVPSVLASASEVPKTARGTSSLSASAVPTLSSSAETLAAQTTPVPTTASVPASVSIPASSRQNQAAAVLMAVVSEKTGYPAEMLEADMSLDADLGIDSIKRVEIFSALQERLPDAPAVKPEHLGTLQTLRDVIDFLNAGRPKRSVEPKHVAEVPPAFAAMATPLPETLVQPVVAEPAPTTTPMASQNGAAVPAAAGASQLQRYAVRAQELASSGRSIFALPSGCDIWIVASDPDLSGELLGDVSEQLSARGYRPRVMGWQQLPSRRRAAALGGLILVAPQAPIVPGLLLQAFRWLKWTGLELRQTGREAKALLATVTRFDGCFGLETLDERLDATAGGLAGLLKTAAREWTEIRCKAIDLDARCGNVAALAKGLVEELFLEGPIEVGIRESSRCTLALEPTALPIASAPLLTSEDVVLVSGGARGVTAEAALALAQAGKPTLVLLGRTPMPAEEPEWLAPLTDENEIKRAIVNHSNGNVTPKVVNDRYRRVMSERELRYNLARLQATGATVEYHSVDVQNREAVCTLLTDLRQRHGKITALVHGAGVLADRKIDDLTEEQFQLVLGTKLFGLQNLLAELTPDSLKALVLFSSTTARLGRIGQVAYAAANEALNKIAQQQRRVRPTTRVLSVNWGPWEGGMVTPSLARLFAAEGVGLIPLSEGGQFLVHELNHPDRQVEVVVLGTKKPVESEPSSGEVKSASSAINPELSLAFERDIDLDSHPILRSHVLDGRAVLPMALHLEWLAHAALHENPGLVFQAFADLRVFHGVTIDEGRSTTVRAYAGKSVRDSGFYRVPVELRGQRSDGREVLHSRAEIVLGNRVLLLESDLLEPPPLQSYPHPHEDIYRYFLFHGADLQGIVQVEGVSETGIVALVRTAPPPARWLEQPLRSHWLADPLALDSAFQAMILWSFAQHGAGSLPVYVGGYKQFRRSFPPGEVRVVARITADNGTVARADLDFLDLSGTPIARMKQYECVIDPKLNQTFRRNHLGPPVKVG